MQIFINILSSVVSAGFVFAASFILFVVGVLSGISLSYLYIPVVLGILILFLILDLIWGFMPKKANAKVIMVTMGLLVVSAVIVSINNAYYDSIASVDEQGIDLTQYEPFRENTKAILLNEPSTLKLDKDLPKMDGATALYPLYAAFARAVYPNGDYPVGVRKADDFVVCSGTVGAYDRLIYGDVDMIFAARPSKEQEEEAKQKGVTFHLTPIGREAFVFFVNASNEIDNLTVQNIQHIYSGNVKNWKELGGKNNSIRAYQRPKNSGSQTMLQKIMGDTKIMEPSKKNVISGMGDIIKRVTEYKNYNNAIGYSFLFYATEMVTDNQIKLLSINDVEPTRENVANKSYPYAAEFYIVTAGTKNENVQKMIDWVLSEQGQKIVEQTGYTSIN